MKKIIKIDRWAGDHEVEKCNWKDLISSLALCGYQVYADEGAIHFELGDGDTVEEVEDND